MIHRSGSLDDSLPLTLVRQIDEACNRFELAWKAGQQPRIEDVVKDWPEPGRLALLRELIALEMDCRRQAGEQPQPQEYRARFPELTDLSDLGLGRTVAETAAAARPEAGWPAVPGYEVLGVLGRGGMGVVYRAWQTGLNRVAALKMIRAGDLANQLDLARFHTEAEAVARLQHPNIVQIYESGQHQGRVYIALECVDGSSLGRELAGTPWPARRAAQLVETLARAMHHAHRQGIVHRDLTPSNVLLTRDGQPKITDFGLAKIIIGGGPTVTQTGAFMGTPSYTAPEQAACRKDVGPAADVYALGAILYECLTGRPPFKAETHLETLHQVQSQEPVSPSRLQPKVPRDLSTICLKCLQKEPTKRYASAEALAEDLGRFLAGLPVRARPMGRTERLWRWCRRNPVVASLLAAVVLLLVVLAGGALVKNAQLAAALRDSEAKRWESLRDQARAVRMSRHPGQRVKSLKAIQEALQLPLPPGHSLDELRTEAIAALALPDVEVLQEWEGAPAGTVGLDFDGNLERYARLATDGTVSVRRVSDDTEIVGWQERTEGAWPYDDSNLRFSPDGRFLCIGHSSSGRLTVRRLDGPEPIPWHQGTKARTDWAMDFSPDGKRLAYLQTDTRIAVVDLTSPQVHSLPPTGAENQACIQFAPDGRRFALQVRRAGKWAVEVRDATTGQLRCSLPHPTGGYPLAWHPDGRTLATCCDEDKAIRLWDLASGQILQVLKGHKSRGVRCAFTHTGDRLVSNDWHAVLRIWEPSSGRQLLPVSAAGYAILRVSSDDRVTASHISDNTRLHLLRLHAGLEYRTIGPGGSGGRGIHPHSIPRVHPGGRLVAAMAWDGSVVLIDLAAGLEVASLPAKAGERPLLWEPSGNLLTYGLAPVLRWPVRADPAGPTRYRLGPPEQLLPYKSGDHWGSSADGQTIAIPNYSRGAVVVHRGQPARTVHLQPQDDVRTCPVSPDGHWVATSSHGTTDGMGAKVWDAATGELAKEFRVPGSCEVWFSPDGRWLMTTSGGCRLWEVGSWIEGPKVGGGIGCFSPDSRLLAVEDSPGAIRLVRPESGRELARLEAPEQTRLRPRCFTPDGTRLIAVGADTQALHVWDLRRIRKELVRLGLDWDPLPYPEAADVPPGPLEVRVVGAELIDPKKMAEYQRNRAILDLALHPLDGAAHFRLGQHLLDAGRPGPAYAVLTAALVLRPDLDEAFNLRAQAAYNLQRWADAATDASHYLDGHADAQEARLLRARSYHRAGRFADAVADCTKLIQHDSGDPKLYRLRAACHDALGHAAKAKADREQALKLAPLDPMDLNNLAWQLATGPADQRDPAWALQLIQEAIKQRPEDGTLLNTLGVVQYRNGQYSQAVVTLEKSLKASKGEFAAFDLFFLAMCHAKLGAPTKARECYDQAVKWWGTKKDLPAQHVRELTAFQAEAQAELGLK
jgi:WD40 repeat protein/Flp pilus assembly protein TadD